MNYFDWREMEFMCGAIEDTFYLLELGLFPRSQINMLKQCFSGKKRQFEALQAAILTHISYNQKLRLESLTAKDRMQLNHFGDGSPSITNEQWINDTLNYHASVIQNHTFAAINSNNSAFFKDYAFFLENPVRTFSKLKLWLMEVSWGGDGDGWANEGTETAPLTCLELRKFEKDHPGCQRKTFSGEQLAELYQKTKGEIIEVSLIYRACRELGIKTKHPKKSRHRKK